MTTPAQDNTDLIDNLLTRLQVAKLLNVTARSLDRWAWQGEGPRRFKIGRLTYYSKQGVKAWLEKLETETGRGAEL